MAKTEILLLVTFMSIIAMALGTVQIMRCVAPRCAAPPPNCSYGVDVRGCPTCNLICNPPGCEQLICPEKCYNGYVKDSFGCNTCDCLPGCYQKKCPKKCPHGVMLDKTGCPTCNCKPTPLECHQYMTCPEGVCPAICACKPNCNLKPIDKEATNIKNQELTRLFWQTFFTQ